MSGRVVGWAAEQVTGSPISKLVLLKLADNANEEGVCWPSIALIVEHTELAKNTVLSHLDRLETMGLLRIERRRNGPVNLPNVYHLAVPAPARRAKNPSAQVDPGGSAGDALPVHPTPRGGAGHAPGVVQAASRHIEEPPFEPSKEPIPPEERAVDDLPSASVEERKADAEMSFAPVFKAYMALPGMENAPVSEADALAAWVRICIDDKHPPEERPTPDEMVGCIAAYGRWLIATNATRPKDRPQMTQFPQNWMRERKFVGYLPEVRKAMAKTQAGADSHREVFDALGADGVALLRRAGVRDHEIGAWFGCGARIELGASAILIIVPKQFNENYIRERFLARIETAAADRPVSLRGEVV